MCRLIWDGRRECAVRQERRGEQTDMIEPSLEACVTKLKTDLLAWCEDIGHVANVVHGFDIVDGYATMSLYEFHIPGNAVFGGQDPDVGRLASTLGE